MTFGVADGPPHLGSEQTGVKGNEEVSGPGAGDRIGNSLYRAASHCGKLRGACLFGAGKVQVC